MSDPNVNEPKVIAARFRPPQDPLLQGDIPATLEKKLGREVLRAALESKSQIHEDLARLFRAEVALRRDISRMWAVALLLLVVQVTLFVAFLGTQA